jgi:hypothetical protein
MEFKRENKYIVIKVKDALQLPPHVQSMLTTVSEHIEGIRVSRGKPDIECIVVENDWPEYGKVWQMIQDRVEGKL